MSAGRCTECARDIPGGHYRCELHPLAPWETNTTDNRASRAAGDTMSERILYTTPAGEQYVATITSRQPDGTINLQYTDASGQALTATNVPLNPTGRIEGGHYYDLPPDDALAILRDGLNAITLNRLARWAVRQAETNLPNQAGETKRQAAIRLVLGLVENVDHLIPLVGPWLDLPPADWAQKIAIGFLIDRAWAWGVNEGWVRSSAAKTVGRP